jgi:endonuclease/exonuclease/phosphatase family metal-dependent hydrolase
MRRNARDLILGTFNLLNLHEAGKPIYGNEGWTQNEYDLKIKWTGQILAKFDADIIGFQELWSPAALTAAFNEAGLAGQYQMFTRDTGTGINVAAAVRNGLAVSGLEWIEAFPDDARFENLREARDAEEMVSVTIRRFSRPVLKLTVRQPQRRPAPPPVTVYVAHLKSKAPTFLRPDTSNPVLAQNRSVAMSVASHVRRMAEAGALRIILNKQMGGNSDPVVVMGDLNDGTSAVSTELLSGNPGYRLLAKSSAGRSSDRGLYSVERLQQLRSYRDVYYTHIFENKMESLDHILVSDAFYDHSENRCWSFREMRVINDHLDLDKSKLPLVGASDHAVVRAVFDWNPAPQLA